MTKFFLFFFMLFLGVYVYALNFFARHYDENRWVPKVFFDIPPLNVTKEQTLFNENNFGSSETVSETEIDDIVSFDTTPLPVIDLQQDWAEEKNAAERYAKPVISENKAKFSIVLTEVGLNDKLFSQVIQKLPNRITLSFSPYSSNLSDKIRYARRNGFENMLDLPVQAVDAYTNGGALSFSSLQDFDVALENLQQNYFNVKVPFIGFFVKGQEFIKSDLWNLLYQNEIQPKGLRVLSNDTMDLFYDKEFNRSVILDELKNAENIAVKNGSYVVVFPMHPIIVETLVYWIGLQLHPDISFVPFSELKGEKYDYRPY